LEQGLIKGVLMGAQKWLKWLAYYFAIRESSLLRDAADVRERESERAKLLEKSGKPVLETGSII